MISVSSIAVLGFSLQGIPVPAGTGVLLELIGDITPDCIIDVILSDSVGIEILTDIEISALDQGMETLHTTILSKSTRVTTSSTPFSTDYISFDSSTECEIETSCNFLDVRCLPTEDTQWICPNDALENGLHNSHTHTHIHTHTYTHTYIYIYIYIYIHTHTNKQKKTYTLAHSPPYHNKDI